MFRGLHIGIDRYADSNVQWLSGAVRDAGALHTLFADTFGASAVLLTDKAATAPVIRAHLVGFAPEATAEDIVVIAYAGHGSERSLPDSSRWGYSPHSGYLYMPQRAGRSSFCYSGRDVVLRT